MPGPRTRRIDSIEQPAARGAAPLLAATMGKETVVASGEIVQDYVKKYAKQMATLRKITVRLDDHPVPPPTRALMLMLDRLD